MTKMQQSALAIRSNKSRRRASTMMMKSLQLARPLCCLVFLLPHAAAWSITTSSTASISRTNTGISLVHRSMTVVDPRRRALLAHPSSRATAASRPSSSLSLVSRTASSSMGTMEESSSSSSPLSATPSSSSSSSDKAVAEGTQATMMEAAAAASSSSTNEIVDLAASHGQQWREMLGLGESLRNMDPAEVRSKAINALLLTASFGFAIYQILNIDHGMTRGWTQSEIAMRIPLDTWAGYEGALADKPIFTKTMINVVIYLLGDWLSQTVFQKKNVLDFVAKRTLRNGFIGLCFGPLVHAYYEFSDSILPLTDGDLWTRGEKILMDQTIYLTIKCSIYIAAVSLLQGDDVDTAKDNVKGRIGGIVVTAWKFWPLVHCLTYSVIPSRHRILWVNMVDLIWNAILASMASDKEPEEEDVAALAAEATLVEGTPLSEVLESSSLPKVINETEELQADKITVVASQTVEEDQAELDSLILEQTKSEKDSSDYKSKEVLVNVVSSKEASSVDLSAGTAGNATLAAVP